MWKEDEHPRAEDGKFTNGNGEYRQNTGYDEILKDERDDGEVEDKGNDLEDILGEEFTNVKGQAAVELLLNKKRGHVKGAFHREDIGDIDLLWGSKTVGLQHILERREEQGIDGKDFVKNLSDVVEKGIYHKKTVRGDFEFWYNGKMAVIAVEYHGNKITYLLTSYKRTKIKTPQR